ncbi:GP179 protein, partial [Menura novaehollandiae]|nr:GP179 protein [Menura novaehollandiae]
ERLEGTSRSSQPREKEQPSAEPTRSSPRPSTTSVRGAKPGAEVCPPGSLGIPAGRGALLRQEAIASREDSGLPESPDKALENGSSQPEPEGVPGRSWNGEGAGSSAGAQGELCPGETRGDSSANTGICPAEQREGRASAKGGREGDSQRSPGMEKPPAQSPELPKVAPEQAAGRRAEVCPWDTREQGRTVPTEICPWDTEGAPLEQERREGERKSTGPKSLESGSSLEAAGQPWGRRGQRGTPKSGEGVEQPGMGLAGKAPALPKSSSQQAGTMDSKKANICPWEVEGEQLPKTEICPWEAAAAPSGKERLSQDTRGTSKGEEKARSRGLEEFKAKLAEMGGLQPQ